MTRVERMREQEAWHRAEAGRLQREEKGMRGCKALNPLKRLVRQRAASHLRTARLLTELLRAK